MSTGEPPSSRRRKSAQNLSAEDQALWNHVARSIVKPRRAKPRIPEMSSRNDDGQASEILARLEKRLMNETSLSEPEAGRGQGRTTAPPLGTPSPASHPARPHSPPLADFDRRSVRRIRSGRIEIEARLDLHGMRQNEAHAALRSFLGGCQARGLRWVLVITGKGSASRDDDGSRPLYESEERGVLRRSVPRWLSEPDLRPLVVSYTTAALHHGGEGALYIQLRARRGGHHR